MFRRAGSNVRLTLETKHTRKSNPCRRKFQSGRPHRQEARRSRPRWEGSLCDHAEEFVEKVGAAQEVLYQTITHQPPLVEVHVIQRDLRAVVVRESLVGHIEPVHRLVPEGLKGRRLTEETKTCGIYSPIWADATDASPASVR